MTQPDTFVIGAPRAATTFLDGLLAAHPEIFMSANKEPWFYAVAGRAAPFTGPGDGQGVRSRAEYEALFSSAKPDGPIGESSTLYLGSDVAPSAIRADAPNARIIVVLRDPVDRAHSNFVQHRWQRRETLSFREAIAAGPDRVLAGWSPFWDYLGMSRYGAHLGRWFDVFPSRQIHVALFDELIADPVETVQEVYRFLSVDAAFVPELDTARNTAGVPRSEALHRLVRSPGRLKRLAKESVPASVRRRLRSAIDARNVAKTAVSDRDRAMLTALLVEDLQRAQALVDRRLPDWLGS